MMAAEKNRAHVAAPSVAKSVAKHVRWLERELGTVDDDLQRAIRESAAWRAKDDLLRAVPGVGRVLATTLLADLPGARSAEPSRDRGARRRGPAEPG